MAQLRPDPSFYPSPQLAAEAPPEKLAYVTMVNGTDDGRPDAIGVVELDPDSAEYGTLVGRVDMPEAGDQLHHFGWNACSSCLCPWAPHPHTEASLPGGAGYPFVEHLHPRHEARPTQSADHQNDRRGDDR